jgi:hypothetical protein
VPFKQITTSLELTVPGQGAIHGVRVIALTMNGSLDGLPSIAADEVGCSFALDSTTYGTIVSRHAKVTTSSTSEWLPADGGATLVAATPPPSFAFHTAPEAAPQVVIDLEKFIKVTGLFIRNANPENAMQRMATLTASVSRDGSNWTEIWKAAGSAAFWQVPVTQLVSGAQIPGIDVRYVRLQTHPKTPEPLLLKQVEVFGKP